MDEEISENEFHIPKNSVLGMQAEACFEAFLKHSKNYELLAANIQIHGSNQTLGELDYIVRNLKTQSIVHIELACKFYLYDETAGISEEEKWIGPNRKDRLIDKLEKIKQQQFPLINATETNQKLRELEIEIPSEQKLCLKAFLFLPFKMDNVLIPKNFQNCIVGYWIRVEEFEENESAKYAIPNKKEWLLPLENISDWYSFSEISERINEQLQNQKSPLIYKKTFQKVERFFVVWW